jgi:hypothetical protein
MLQLQRMLSPVALVLIMVVSFGALRLEEPPSLELTQTTVRQAEIATPNANITPEGVEAVPVATDPTVFLIDGSIDPRSVPAPASPADGVLPDVGDLRAPLS